MENSRKLETFLIMENIMKKQIVAAAVAASISAVAMADISITGAAKVNYTNVDSGVAGTADTNNFKQEMDLKVKGKSGDTEVVINFGGDGLDATGTAAQSGGMNVEDAYVSTSVAGVKIKSGTWDSGNNELRASARKTGKFQANYDISGVGLSYLTASDNAGTEEYGISTSVAGVSLGFTKKAAGETIKASTSIGGINVKYLGLPSDTANNDRDYYEVSTTVGGVGIKVGQANADDSATIEGDTWMGDFEDASGAYDLTAGQDVQTVELSTSMAGNKVAFRNTQIDGVAGADTDFNKIIITRPLASGATFELTYTDLDDQVDANDSDTLDLELAVKF